MKNESKRNINNQNKKENKARQGKQKYFCSSIYLPTRTILNRVPRCTEEKENTGGVGVLLAAGD